MGRIRTWLVVATVAALGATIGPAGPAGAGSTPDVCEPLVTLDQELGGIDAAVDLADFDPDVFTETGKAFRAAAADASTKSLRSALKRLAKIYKKAGKADDLQEASTVFIAKSRTYSKAALALATYLAEECAGVSVPTTSGSSRTDGGSSGSGATITVDSEEHTLDGSESCTLSGGTLLSTFEDGNDMVSVTQAGSTVLIRMTIDGVDWVDTGSPPAPDISGKRVRWAGEMSEFDGDRMADVTIEFTC